jgi:hypothetical protein
MVGDVCEFDRLGSEKKSEDEEKKKKLSYPGTVL